MIVLKKETFNLLIKESKFLGVLFLLLLVIFKIAFFNENLNVILRSVVSLFWIFLFPGYLLMLAWSEKLNFAERLIIGFVLSAAIIGLASYYVGLIGINIKYHFVLLPLILIGIGIINIIRK